MIDARFQPMDPKNQPKTPGNTYRRSPFKSANINAMDDLERELRFLEATDVVIEGGFRRDQIRNDGWPRGSASPDFPDIRLFFKCKHGDMVYECAAFTSWEANLRAIALWMQRQRLAIEEWGIGTGGEAYRGFAALPPGGTPMAEFASVEAAMRFLCSVGDGSLLSTLASDLGPVYRAAARKAHPDAGGNESLMSKVNRAKDFVEKHAQQ